jgi:hypothetical protein
MSTGAPTEKFNVVILYKRRAFVGQAMSTYLHVKRELGNELETDLRLWRTDVAASEAYAAQADHDIEAADLIILAVCGDQPCPPAFRRWQTGTGRGLGMPRGAVIIFAETAAGPTPATETWNSMLRGFTTQIHPEIYVWDPPVVRHEAAPAPRADEPASLLVGATTAD